MGDPTTHRSQEQNESDHIADKPRERDGDSGGDQQHRLGRWRDRGGGRRRIRSLDREDLSGVGIHDDGSLLRMGLFYGGRLWGGPVLERALDAKVAESSERLLQLVTGQI